jgi:predicted DNA-binding transcriptional regulator YafY
MRRADRLFQIIQLLKNRRLTTASLLAEVLEVSTRTIYRDIQDLIANGIPVEGEAGVGYLLRREVDIPPLMFNESELEAIQVGMRMVEAWGGSELASAAKQAQTSREVRPLAIHLWRGCWTLLTWCELRNDFRNFRINRIVLISLTPRFFPVVEGEELDDFIKEMQRKYG